MCKLNIELSNSISDIVLSPVHVTALNSQTISVGESLSLKCSVSANHLNNSVVFIWKANGVELHRATVDNASNTTDNGTTFTHLYNTTSLTQSDNNTIYMCRVVIDGNPSLTEFDVFQLNLPSYSEYIYTM